METKKKRGMAAMDPATQRRVARLGGLSASRNRKHMAEIGRRGGLTTSKDREYMAEIGQRGGNATQARRMEKVTA